MLYRGLLSNYLKLCRWFLRCLANNTLQYLWGISQLCEALLTFWINCLVLSIKSDCWLSESRKVWSWSFVEIHASPWCVSILCFYPGLGWKWETYRCPFFVFVKNGILLLSWWYIFIRFVLRSITFLLWHCSQKWFYFKRDINSFGQLGRSWTKPFSPYFLQLLCLSFRCLHRINAATSNSSPRTLSHASNSC